MENTTNGNLSLLKNEFLASTDGKSFRVTISSPVNALVDGVVCVYDLKKTGPDAYSLIMDERVFDVLVETSADFERTNGSSPASLRVSVDGRIHEVTVDDHRSLLQKSLLKPQHHRAKSQVVRAPMPGLVVRVEVGEGEEVRAGQGLIVLEAMKMENEIRAQSRGKIEKIFAQAGKPVEKGEPLLSIVHD